MSLIQLFRRVNPFSQIGSSQTKSGLHCIPSKDRSNSPSCKRLRRMSIEPLEERAMLNAAPVLDIDSNTYNITAGQPWYIALRADDADSDAVYYIVETESTDLNASLSYGTAYDAENLVSVEQRNPYWKLTVEQKATENNPGFSGSMLFELFADSAPNTVSWISALTKLQMYTIGTTEYNYYDNMLFYRVISGFMSQCGRFNNMGGSDWTSFPEYITAMYNLSTREDEFSESLRFTSPSVLGMANNGNRDANFSEFFITDSQTSHLDFKHTVFGFLNDGADIMEKVNNVSTSGDQVVTQTFSAYNSTAWSNYEGEFQNVPTTPVILTKAEIVTNYTGSTLTVSASAGSNYTTTLTVTPVDANGNRGAAQTITVVVTPDASADYYDYPPILDDSQVYAVFYPNQESTFQLKYLDLNGDAAGFTGFLYTYDSTQQQYAAVESGYSVDYQTGVVTLDGSLTPGSYYLYTYIGNFDSSAASLSMYTDHHWIAVIVAPEAPTSVTLASSSDSGTLGDGVTSQTKNLSFVVEGCVEGYTVAVVARGTENDQILGTAVCEAGNTTVTVTTTATFEEGAYDLYAIQENPNQPFLYNGYGWYSLTVDSGASAAFSLTINLSAPANLCVSDILSTSLKAAWDAVEDAQGYRIYWKKEAETNWYYDDTTETSCTIYGLEPGTQYKIAVMAFSNTSSSDIVYLEETVQTLYQLPAPANVADDCKLVVDPQTENESLQIAVSWTPAEGVLSYNVYFKSLEESQWNYVTTPAAEAGSVEPLSCVLENLDPNKIYEYQVISMPDAQTQTNYDQSIGVDVWTYASDLENQFSVLDYSVQSISDWTYDKAVKNGIRSSLTSVHEWQSLVVELWGDKSKTYATGDTLRFVIQYDSRLWTADSANVALIEGVVSKTQQQKVSESGYMVQLEILISVTDGSKIGSDGLFAYIPFYPSDQSSENSAKNGVAATEIQVSSTLTPFIPDSDSDGALISDPDAAVELTVWAVPYDLNDTGTVDMDDFIQFANVFNQTPDRNEKTIANAANFDDKGAVSMDDFILFAQHFNQSWSQNPTINIPRQTAAAPSAAAPTILEAPAQASTLQAVAISSELASEDEEIAETVATNATAVWESKTKNLLFEKNASRLTDAALLDLMENQTESEFQTESASFAEGKLWSEGIL